MTQQQQLIDLKPYIATLERDLLELPGEPYKRCDVCGRLHLTHNLTAVSYNGNEWFICGKSECTDKCFGSIWYEEEGAF